jgi:hypothetical protein
VTERRAAAEERNELRTAQAATAEEVRARQAKIDFVAEAASVLSSSGDVRSTVRQVAALAAARRGDRDAARRGGRVLGGVVAGA